MDYGNKASATTVAASVATLPFTGSNTMTVVVLGFLAFGFASAFFYGKYRLQRETAMITSDDDVEIGA